MEKVDILEKLNDRQKEAVLSTEGPLLILAGAGSGKTRVLVHRISYMIHKNGVYPGNILAITFTNKAADEMRTRVDAMVGYGSKDIWVMTFHAFCVRILRRYAEEIGFSRYFSIYDTDDQLRLMKDIFRRRGIDPKRLTEKSVLRAISQQKNELVEPEEYARKNMDSVYMERLANLYKDYQQRLQEANAMDFDDLLGHTVRLFERHPDILERCQERFRYIMVDEYQDTNTAQFRLVKLLSDKYRNLCVVGDDDQSIYKFRGADIRNILDFQSVFGDAKVVRLEQNYRSTQTILDAANAVIANNGGRMEKSLWTDAGAGERIHLRTLPDSFLEAVYVADEIQNLVEDGERNYRDFAVLYRTNAQSRLFEEKMISRNIPYKLVGGVNFYARREIKDVLAYLKLLDNPADDISAQRIINVPRRGIGETTIRAVIAAAVEGGMPFYKAALLANENPNLKKAAARKVGAFTNLIEELREEAGSYAVDALLRLVIEKTGYTDELRNEGTDEARERIENIDELVSKAAQYAREDPEPSLSGFLQEVALVADIDSVEEGDNRVLLMTLHGAKGLEFPVVFLSGMEEGLFPSQMSIESENSAEAIEEERRLCYVGITRAKESLTLTAASVRMFRGEMHSQTLSRFVREIPRSLLELGGRRGNAPKPAFPENGINKDLRDALTKKTSSFGRYDNPYIPNTGQSGITAGSGKSWPAAGPDKSGSPARVGQSGITAGSGKSWPAAGPDKSVSPARVGQSGTAAGFGKAWPAAGADKSGSPTRVGQSGITAGSGKAWPAVPSSAAPSAAQADSGEFSGLGYGVGDRVRHVKFGLGTVLAIRDRGRDFEVTVDFPSWGTKKMFAAFAKLVRA